MGGLGANYVGVVTPEYAYEFNARILQNLFECLFHDSL
jgi:hypothetical protein